MPLNLDRTALSLRVGLRLGYTLLFVWHVVSIVIPNATYQFSNEIIYWFGFGFLFFLVTPRPHKLKAIWITSAVFAGSWVVALLYLFLFQSGGNVDKMIGAVTEPLALIVAEATVAVLLRIYCKWLDE